MAKMKIGKFAPLHFAVSDSRLRDEIWRGIIPHISDVFGLGFFLGKEARRCLDDISVDIYVVGVSASPSDTALDVIEVCQERGQACGVIVKTEDFKTWSRLSELHRHSPFAFVIAASGACLRFRGLKLEQMFSGAPVLSDVSDLLVPGKRIARFIDEAVARQQRSFAGIHVRE